MQTEIPEFGIKRENEERRDGGCAVVFDPATRKYAVGKQDGNGWLRLFSGGVSADENIKDGVLREIVEESGLCNFSHVEQIGVVTVHFYNNLKNVNRIALATCFLVILENTDLVPTKLEPHEKFSLAWASSGEIIANWEARNQEHDYDHWIYFMKKAVARIQELE